MTSTLPESVPVARRLVDPGMREAVDRLAPRMREVAGYHLGWWDGDGRPRDSGGGKYLRATLTLLSAEAAGAEPRDAVPAGVAVELVHNFSLLHDDIMDGDRERRHRPTAWTVFGRSSAILAGDALLNLAFEVLGDGGGSTAWTSRALSAATQRLITGQADDLSFEDRLDVPLSECLSMAADKTAALMSCATSLGAMHVNAPAPLALGLAEFGSDLGLAFQLVDDLLGIWGSPDTTGKPALADLRARKKSVPVVAALTSGTPAGDELLELYRQAEPLDEEQLVRAAGLVEQAGGRAWTEAEAGRRVSAAERWLDSADPPAPVRAELMAIAAFVTGRDR